VIYRKAQFDIPAKGIHQKHPAILAGPGDPYGGGQTDLRDALEPSMYMTPPFLNMFKASVPC
jgi:hypothetical protein